MSTKTTFKRIALVAVAALGFGVLTSVAPATAANGRVASAITIGSATSFKTGAVNIIPITVTYPSTNVSGDTTTVTVQITAAPTTGGLANAASVMGAGSTAGANGTLGSGERLYFASDSIGTKNAASGTTYTLVDAAAAGSEATTIADGESLAGQFDSTGVGISEGQAGQVMAAAVSVASAAAGVTTKTVYLAFKPDLAGSYSILVASNATGRSYYAAGDTSATATFATTGSVATVTLSALNTSPVGVNPAGVVLKAVLKDAAGLGTTLGSLDSIQLTSSSASDAFTYCSSASADCTGTVTNGTLTAAMFNNGVGFFKVSNSGTASTISTITATGSGTLPTTVTSTVAATFKALGDLGATADNTVTVGKAATTGYDGTITAGSTSPLSVSSTAASSGLKFTFSTGADAVAALAALTATTYGYVTITDTYKKIFGADSQVGISYQAVYSVAAAALTGSISVAHAALGTSSNTYSIAMPTADGTTIGATAGTVVTMTGAAAGSAGTNVLTATPGGPIAASAGGKLTISANLVDRFGKAIPSASVTASVAGRNTVAATALVTDALGNVTFSYTDAGTTATNDTVTFSNSSNASATATDSVTVSYSTAAVKTVTITGGDTTASVANATVTVKPISAGDGAEAGVVGITATVKDANGSLLVGVPVTFSVAGTGVAVPSDVVTVWTGSAGTAASAVYAWIAGNYTYTATAGGVSTTGKVTFGSITPGNARVLSATAEGNVVTAKVVDRFGNPVKGVTVYATKSGTGYFGSGLSRTSDTTLADGTVQFGITGGNASVTVSTLNPADPAGTNAAGQTCALAGNVDCASGATAAEAFTAYTAGTTLVREEGVGASLAPAGVSSATVEVTDAASSNASAAADAAAEATDAANAATDAANAAAEAADAATAAAQDAADAVAALSTQVSEMVNALKKQITALTNLVIKIQKKVKA
jgi:trimeric autotransporter adhesin